ncbi:MAG: hypothetical protein ACI9OJ_003152 [Myxococcota bacterium]|jgi:hypothetical protein
MRLTIVQSRSQTAVSPPVPKPSPSQVSLAVALTKPSPHSATVQSASQLTVSPPVPRPSPSPVSPKVMFTFPSCNPHHSPRFRRRCQDHRRHRFRRRWCSRFRRSTRPPCNRYHRARFRRRAKPIAVTGLAKSRIRDTVTTFGERTINIAQLGFDTIVAGFIAVDDTIAALWCCAGPPHHSASRRGISIPADAVFVPCRSRSRTTSIEAETVSKAVIPPNPDIAVLLLLIGRPPGLHTGARTELMLSLYEFHQGSRSRSPSFRLPRHGLWGQLRLILRRRRL